MYICVVPAHIGLLAKTWKLWSFRDATKNPRNYYLTLFLAPLKFFPLVILSPGQAFCLLSLTSLAQRTPSITSRCATLMSFSELLTICTENTLDSTPMSTHSRGHIDRDFRWFFLISEKRNFHVCFFFYSSREKEWGVNCPNQVKKWPRYRLPKFVDCPTFFTTRRVHWVLGWRHTSRSPPHGAQLCLAPSTPVSTCVRSSGRCASCMREYAASIDLSLLAFILGTTATLFRKDKDSLF